MAEEIQSGEVIAMKQLLEAGVHFGHQTSHWNPKMKTYIFGMRNGIHIIDLQQTSALFKRAYSFARDIVSDGGAVLFVGTKKQAQGIIVEEATRCDMPYVSTRWLGGALTNFHTIRSRVDYLFELEKVMEDEAFQLLPKKEAKKLERERQKLDYLLGGIRKMRGIPDALFVIDTRKEHTTVKEAKKLRIPVIAVIDTNCDPEDADYPIPGNDDAIRAVKLFTSKIADACIEGKHIYETRVTAGEITRKEAEESTLIVERKAFVFKEYEEETKKEQIPLTSESEMGEETTDEEEPEDV